MSNNDLITEVAESFGEWLDGVAIPCHDEATGKERLALQFFLNHAMAMSKHLDMLAQVVPMVSEDDVRNMIEANRTVAKDTFKLDEVTCV